MRGTREDPPRPGHDQDPARPVSLVSAVWTGRGRSLVFRILRVRSILYMKIFTILLINKHNFLYQGVHSGHFFL